MLQEKLVGAKVGIYWIFTKGNNFETKYLSGLPKKTSKWQDSEIFRLVPTENLFVQSVFKEVSVPIIIHDPSMAARKYITWL